MAVTVKYNSRQVERTDSGIVTTLAWIGPRQEIEALGAAILPGDSGEDGILDSVRVFQDNGPLWVCERRYRRDPNNELPARNPNANYGKKSASLHGSMLSMPLEANPKYKANWNHYLVAAPGITAVPEWWETAKDTIIIDTQKYAWIKSLGELPVSNGTRWHELKEPQKKGLNSYDLATYSVTETAKFTSPEAAGRMVANKLNKIGSPSETFGITGGDWKCDDASVSYRDRAWYATLTWTLSGDSEGWDKDLYQTGN